MSPHTNARPTSQETMRQKTTRSLFIPRIKMCSFSIKAYVPYSSSNSSSPLCLLEPKVIILQGHSSHNTIILPGVYNLSTSTTCFGQCCCGHHQVGYNLSEKLYRYDITQNEISFPITYTNTNNCSVLYHIYIASLINCIQPDGSHSSIGRNM